MKSFNVFFVEQISTFSKSTA